MAEGTAVVKSSSDPEAISRLANEYTTLRGLAHDAVVRVKEWIELVEQGRRVSAGYMMCRCNGETLRKRLKQPRPEGLAAQHATLSSILSGVAYLHDMRISHRDLHCGNLVVDDTGFAVLIDFGNAHKFGRMDSWDINADLTEPDMDCARTLSSLSGGAGTVSDILPPREGLGSGRERDCFAVGLLGVGLVRWTEIATEDIYIRDEKQAPRLKASPFGSRTVGPALTAVLHGLLHVVPGRRCTAQSALDELPLADAWFAQ
jgi:serine/threonine protein kinase